MQRSLRTEGNGAVGGKKKQKQKTALPPPIIPSGNIWAICFFTNPNKVMNIATAVPSCPGGRALIITRWASSFSQLQGPFTPLTVYITPLESRLGIHTSPSMLGWRFLPGWNSTAPEAAKLTRNPGRLGISSGHILALCFVRPLHFCVSDGDKGLLPMDLIS